MTATPDPRIAAYVAEIEKPGIPFVSNSHGMLHQLYCSHGSVLVQQLLQDYFAEVRAEQQTQ